MEAKFLGEILVLINTALDAITCNSFTSLTINLFNYPLLYKYLTVILDAIRAISIDNARSSKDKISIIF